VVQSSDWRALDAVGRRVVMAFFVLLLLSRNHAVGDKSD